MKKKSINQSKRQTKCGYSQGVKDFIYIHSTLSSSPVYSIGSIGIFDRKHVFCFETREEIGDCRCGDTYDVAHFAMRCVRGIAEPMDVSKPAECRNYSLRCTLCSGFSVHPFSFSPSTDVGPTLSRVRTHTLSHSLRLFGSISLDRLDLLYLVYPAATIPHLYALIPVHTDSGYLRESIPRATFTLHNASDLCFFLCAASVTIFRERRKATLFHTRPSSFLKYVESNVNIFNTRVNIFQQIANAMIICTINCPEVENMLRQTMK